MSLIVQKYGGTSVGSPERIAKVAERVQRARSEGHQVVVVVSAMSGETDRLIRLAKDIAEKWLASSFDPKGASGANVEALNKLDA